METPNRKLLTAKASMWSLLVALFLSAFLLCFPLCSSVSFAFFVVVVVVLDHSPTKLCRDPSPPPWPSP